LHRNRYKKHENTLKAFDEILEKHILNYVDLYLIHWPIPKDNKYVETYEALEKNYIDGRAMAIRVCNFKLSNLDLNKIATLKNNKPYNAVPSQMNNR